MKIVREEKSESSKLHPARTSGAESISSGKFQEIKKRRREKISRKYTLVTQIAGHSFRYAFLARKGDLLDVGSFGEISLKDIDVISSDPVDLYQAGISWLKANSDLGYERTIMVCGGLDFFVRRLQLPGLKKHEVFEAASWEVEKQIPIPVKESYLLLKQSRLPNGFIDVIAAAVPRRQIDRWQYLGPRLAGVVPVPVCLVCLGPRSESREEAYCYLYESDGDINIGFYNACGLQYVHSVPAGETGDRVISDDSSLPAERTLMELMNNVEIFFGRFPDMTLKGIALLIRPENGQPLARMIQQRIGIEVITVDTDSRMNPGSRGLSFNDPRYFPILGGALLERDAFKYIPEALTAEIKYDRIRKFRKYILAAGLAVNTIAGSLWIARAYQARRELNQAESLKNTLETSSAYMKCVEYQSGIQLLTSLTAQFERRGDDHARFLKVLSNITPSSIYMENATLSGLDGRFRFNVAGYYDGDLSKSEAALIQFMEGFKSQGMDQLKLQRLGRKFSGKRKIESFVLEGKW